jgi:arabinogalactan oligomer/maltooligosaccharide transport system permease protein
MTTAAVPPGGRRSRHRRLFAVGLAVAALFAAAVESSLLSGAVGAERRARRERAAVVTLQALAAAVDRAGSPAAPSGQAAGQPAPSAPPGNAAGGEAPSLGMEAEIAAATAAASGGATGAPQGEEVRRAVQSFAAAHPEVAAIRVIVLEDRRLDASTDPADRGEKAAPRALARDEKPLYDLGQKLRAAVAANREAGQDQGARQEELAVARQPGGGLALAAPVERGGEVVGMVQMLLRPASARSAPPWGALLLAWLAPVLAFALLALALGERRPLLAAAAALLLCAALFAFARYAAGRLGVERRETGKAVAAAIATEKARAEAAAGKPVPAAEAAAWDADLYRRPYGLVTPDGALDEAKLARAAQADRDRGSRAATVAGVLALALLAFVGLGGASRVGRDLVQYRVAYAYTLPAMIGMVVLVFFPFLYGVALSFTNDNIYNSDKPITETWVGLSNFVDILGDFHVVEKTPSGLVANYQNFYWTLGFTIVWTVTNVAIGVTVGLLLALILNTKGLAFRPIYRVLLILPWAMPNYITALIWKGMFHPQFGIINQLIQICGGHPVSWFSRPFTSFLAVLSTNGWLSFPFMMVISLGALQSISADLYEAARVDGASRWQQFRSITLPSLKPALVPAVILSVIWTFNMFNIIYLVSAGEPSHSTEILITQAYKLAFEQYRYGYAAAYSVVIFVILFAYGTWQNRVTRATEAI